MISAEKQRNALHAINAVLVVARWLAYEQRTDRIAEILDVAEFLPCLMLEPADRTDEFRQHLVGLERRMPGVGFARALQRFDAVE